MNKKQTWEIAITLDKEKCIQCRRCINRMRDYCIHEENGYPAFDYQLCNLCQKCVAICPQQAILVYNTPPEKITTPPSITPGGLAGLFRQRRSIKVFSDRKIPGDLIKQIVESGKYAPNQNKNIDVIVIDDMEILDYIDKKATSFFLRLYRVLFSFKPLTLFFVLFTSQLPIVKKKMVYSLWKKKKKRKKGTQAAIILTGKKSVPVTESSAHYILCTMIWYAETLGVGSCLMDSVKITLEHDKQARKRLGIKDNVLGVLTLGYSAEQIVNIPRGYELKVTWNPDSGT
jgi:Pyruvate/2-oxoacid:ferredoxin oxidoreductase delta subunit